MTSAVSAVEERIRSKVFSIACTCDQCAAIDVGSLHRGIGEMPLHLIHHSPFRKRAAGDDVVRTGAENDAVPDADAIRASGKHTDELAIHLQRRLRRIAVYPHVCYAIGPLRIKAGVDVHRWRFGPVGFVKKVRVFSILVVEGDDALSVDVLGIALAAGCASEIEGVPEKRSPEEGLAPQRRPVLFVNVGLVLLGLWTVARFGTTQHIVRSAARWRRRHRTQLRPSVERGGCGAERQDAETSRKACRNTSRSSGWRRKGR